MSCEITPAEAQELLRNKIVVPKNTACIRGIDFSEVAGLFFVIDVFDIDSYQNEIKLLRLFVKKLHANLKERQSCKTPIVKGLLNTKDDYTFVTFAHQLREGLWV